MTPTAADPDPIDNVPDPETLRRTIAAAVRRTELLRQLLRLSIRRERLGDDSAQPQCRRKGVSANG
ncbi:unnamed protein product [Gemmataceae bacterium]|nr:unnamed protein product [Gemmataceae bacterium]VTT99018.1 unnamed protein product [Gemmataceae bacterium]